MIPGTSQIDGFFTKSGGLAMRSNVSETDRGLTITAELPGVEQKDVDVSLTGNRITIRGEKKSETEDKKVTIKNAISIESSVLTLTVPKPAELIEKEKGRDRESSVSRLVKVINPTFELEQSYESRQSNQARYTGRT